MRPHTISGPGSAATDYELITLAKLKEYLRDSGLGTTEDTLVGEIAAGINRDAHAIMRGRFVLDMTEWDQVYSLDWAQVRLHLEQRPVNSVSFVEYGYFGDAGWTTIDPFASTDYVIDATGGALVRNQPWRWPSCVLGLRVKYRAGWAATPPDLQLEMAKWGKVVFNRIVGDRIDKMTITHEAEVTQYRAGEIPDETLRILERYSLKGV